MLFAKPPIRRIAGGRYAINLGPHERDLLVHLADQLTELLKNPDNPGLHRSFPPAYQGVDNLEHSEEYRRLMTDELVNNHRGALATLAESAQATELSEEQLNAWMRALNQLRLTLGTRLHLSDDSEIDRSSTEGQIYEFLTFVQGDVIEALAGD
ncbi:MAG: DUF2017 domain-containing protein [Actinomycetota bacterium]|nr:DUF2017 domain-containing protein [Actinomycetota bacterium]